MILEVGQQQIRIVQELAFDGVRAASVLDFQQSQVFNPSVRWVSAGRLLRMVCW